MTRVEVTIKEAELPPDAEPMARITLTTGREIELSLDEWSELWAKLELGHRK